MASAQATAVNEKQQLAAKAKNVWLSKHNNGVNQSQESAALSIRNGTVLDMNFKKSNEWYGSVKPPSYPQSILPGSAAPFNYSAGSAAVVYYVKNNNGVSCAWLLAWSALSNPSATPNKVYVECGPDAKYDTIDWSIIQAKLDGSGSTSNYFDPTTNTTNYAQIDNSSSFAAVGATFGAA